MNWIFLSYEFCELSNLRILQANRIRYTNTNNTNFNSNFSNLDVITKGVYPNWSNSFFIFVQFVLKKINVATLNRVFNFYKNNIQKVFLNNNLVLLLIRSRICLSKALTKFL
jgi:hypothetical protein